jgi:hypothetical protein
MAGVEKIVSFASWANDHPTDRIPGDRLDAQFDAHARAISLLEERIARLLRADGKLNHGLLTVDSFPAELHEEMARKILAQVQEERVAIQRAAMAIGQTRREIVELLHNAKVFAAEQVEDYARSLDLIKGVVAVQEQLKAKLEPLAAQAADTLATADNSQNDAALAAATAQDWAQVSIEWAEHMPDTIPPNILAITGISGNHWSSRWWASQAAATISGFAGVNSFNGRSGAVMLSTQDIIDAGGAPIVSPYFIGNPQAPTPAATDADNSIATTAFVKAAIAGSVAGVNSFNTRQGDIVLTNADVAAVFPGSDVAPRMDGTAGAGTGVVWSRSDHVHPSDTSRLALSGGTMTGPISLANDPVALSQPVTLQYLQSYRIDAGTY